MTAAPTPPPAGRPKLEGIAAKHCEHPPVFGVLGMVAYCAECYENWPCDAAVFWDEKISAEARVAEALAHLHIVTDALRQYEADDCTCGPDAGWPSCCACYSRAALKVVE